MPKKNGHDTFLALKATDPAVKVIIASGFSQNTSVTKLLDNGAKGFIQKPFRFQELSKKIALVMREG